MLLWTEINCTACKKCSFCADKRNFYIDYCSFKADLSTLEFLVALLSCSAALPGNSRSWFVCEKRSADAYYASTAGPSDMCTPPPLSFSSTHEIKLICMEMRFRLFAFLVCISEQLVRNVFPLNSALWWGGDRIWERDWREKGVRRHQRLGDISYESLSQTPKTRHAFSHSKWISYIPPNLPLKQAINQQRGVCRDERWLARSFSGIVTPVCTSEIQRRSDWQMLFGARWISPKPRFVSPPNITGSQHERGGTNVP